MAYLLLIVEPRGQRDERRPDEAKRAYADMVRFGEGLTERGVLKAVESLQSDASGVRVAVRGGKRSLRDGPFTEAKKMERVKRSYLPGSYNKSRAHRDRVLAKVMKDPRLAKMMNPAALPFDGMRMFWGGFKTMISV